MRSSKNVGNDMSFDNLATKFDKSIYGSTKGKLRHEMLLHNLQNIWSLCPDNFSALDAGGGTGEFTKELLPRFKTVTLNDISVDTLNVAREKLCHDNLHLHHGPIQELRDTSFDFIACHAVFEWLEQPQLVLQHLLGLLKERGIMSLSFFNKDANLFGNLLYGNFELVNNNMKQKNRLKLASHSPIKPSNVLSWLEGEKVEIVSKAGIRCFHDYLRDKRQQEENYEELLAMEKRYCQEEPYVWLGKYFHLVIRKCN